MSERSAFQRFIDELRRRHVPQTAAVYLVAAWAAIEFSDVVVPNLNGPQWVVTAVIIAAIVGLPVVLVLAWIFDWGPEGLQRTSEMTEAAAGSGGAAAPPRTSAPWAAALAVLVVAVASALAVAAVLNGNGGDASPTAAEDTAETGRGQRSGERADVPAAPPPPPAIVGPGYGDSIRNEVLRSFEGMEGLAGMAALRELGDLDSVDLSDIADIGRRMAMEAGLQLLIRTPAEWRLGVDEPVRLAPGDTLVIEGLAQDSAGIVSVSVDGTIVRNLDDPGRTVRFRATVVGTAADGSRTVPIVVRTVDGREIRQEHEIVQRPGGAP